MPNREPMLRVVPGGVGVKTGQKVWEPHPDGAGGLRPVIEAVRGDVNLPCPNCGAPLIREGSEALIRRSVVGCSACKHWAVGQDVALAPGPGGDHG